MYVMVCRIDSTAGTVVMGTQFMDPLDAIVERTNQLSVRTFKLANSINLRIEGEQRQVTTQA